MPETLIDFFFFPARMTKNNTGKIQGSVEIEKMQYQKMKCRRKVLLKAVLKKEVEACVLAWSQEHQIIELGDVPGPSECPQPL